MITRVNDCVLIPNLPHWEKPKLSYRFNTSIGAGIDGSEDRAVAGQVGKYRTLSYPIQARTAEERAVLSERLKAALLDRRACVPLFVRSQDVQLIDAPDHFIGVVGYYPWAVGDYVYMARYEHDGINRDVFINCGGSLHDDWSADCLYTSGTPYSVADTVSIDTSGVTTLEVPPQTVLRSCRARVAGQFTRYTITGLKRGEPCLVRLWFAVIDASQTGTMSIAVTGLTNEVTRFWSPYVEAGSVLNKLVVKEVTVSPDHTGTISILIGHEIVGSTTQFINAIEIRQAVWDICKVTRVFDGPTVVPGVKFLEFENLLNIAKIEEQYYQACPLLFGEPSAGDLEYETPTFEETKLTVKEPIGSIVSKRAAACSPEICGLPTVPPPPIITPTVVGEHASMFVMTGEDTPTQYTAYAAAVASNEWATWDERAEYDAENKGTYSIANGRWELNSPDSFPNGGGYVSVDAKYKGMGNIDNFVVGITTVQPTRDEEDRQFSNAYHMRVSNLPWWVYTYDIMFTPDP